MRINIDKIYVCHWDKLIERKEFLIEQFYAQGIHEYEWVTQYDKDTWDIDNLILAYPFIFKNNPKNRLLKPSEISLALKHIHILKDSYRKYDDIMVFEDDVLLENGFIDKFNHFKSQLPDDWDLCWIGTCCGLKSTKVFDENMHVYPEKSSRCTHAYIISNRCIEKIINEIDSVNDGIDWYFNQLINKLNLSNYWFEPSLASQNKMFNTTIQI